MFADVGILRWTESASAWLLTYVVHSTLLIGAVWFATSWKRMRDTTRDVLWKVGLVGGLVTASIQTAVGHEPLGGQLRLGARPAEAQQEVRVAVRENVVAERAFIVAHPKSTRWTAAIVVMWLTGAGAALLWLTIAHARAGRALGDRTSLDGAPIASRLQWLLARAGVQAVAEFLCDDWAVQRTSQPVMLAKCLAAVAEWVARGPRLHAMSAMVESGGSPLVQRVRRILGGGHAMRAASSRGALGASACALVALAAGAPRVSIASEAITHRTITFVRSIVDRNDGPAPLGGRLMIVDSDSIGLRSMWTRPLPAPVGAAAGARVLGGGPRARMIVIERLK